MDEIVLLCREFEVERLELFGSATFREFDPEQSDIDFLVMFKALSPRKHADCYFGLLESLQDLFPCRVDLVELRAIRNPYFLVGVNSTRVQVYAA